MTVSLFTGYPGFLGVELVPRVLRRDPQRRAICVVQAKFAEQARRVTDTLVARDPALADRITLVEGDITQPDLGLVDLNVARANLTEIWHLAAVYDLAVARDLADRVNVEGTRHVCDLAERSDGLERLHYVSTCYVSGRYTGPFAETDLDVGQTFSNHYEETKFLAEVEVSRRRHGGLPTTVYRPAIVVGDSTTGATQKYDGPYFALQWLLRQPKVALLPAVGDPTSFRFNIVPRDFVVDAIAMLSADERSKDRVYQLADPHPLTVDQLYREMAQATERRLIRLPITRRIAKFALDKVPGVYALMRIPSDAVDYLTHPTHYLTTNTETDLDGSGVSCPSLPTYLPTIVDFMRRHPEIGHEAMV